MTKKHFEVIALQINAAKQKADGRWNEVGMGKNRRAGNPLLDLAVNLADEFEQINPNFNRSKFLAVALA